MIWAKDFSEIIPTLSERADLLSIIERLVFTEKIPGKALEGSGRTEKFREILMDVFRGDLSLIDSYQHTSKQISRASSPHSSNNRVFPSKWEERLIRTNISRFYNQAVLLRLIELGETNCFIPHSKDEESSSKCSMAAGRSYEIEPLLATLIDVYSNENWKNESLKIPEHPHCTHVISPL